MKTYLKKSYELFDIGGDTPYAVSDNCCNKVKNWILIVFWLSILAKQTFKKIVHIFPIVGYTILPIDRNSAHVEYSSSEWVEVLAPAQTNYLFILIFMEQEALTIPRNCESTLNKINRQPLVLWQNKNFVMTTLCAYDNY